MHLTKRILFMTIMIALIMGIGGCGYPDEESTTVSTEDLSSILERPVTDIPVIVADEIDWDKEMERRKMTPTITDFKLKVVTYNIRHGQGLDDVVSLDRVAGVLESMSPDIIALQEVDKNFGSRSNWEDQAQILADKLGMEVAYGPALKSFRLLGEGGYYGNAVLSRFPVQAVTNTVIDAPGFRENRAFLHTVVETPVGKVNFISTHLGLQLEERTQHVVKLLEYVGQLPGPVIVAGDFNTTNRSGELDGLYQSGLIDSASAVGKVSPTLIGEGGARIDYIFASSDVSAYDVETIDADASDHRPVAGLFNLNFTQADSRV